MSGFAALMALSARQTKQSAVETESLLAERRRKEEQRRKDEEAKERKERELQKRLLQKRFEEEQRERERQQKAEEERRQKEALIQKREEEQRNSLLYGPKAAKSRTVRSQDSRAQSQRSRSPDSGDSGGASALTREEKRQRKLQADLNRSLTSKRSLQAGHHRAGKQLRGGAVDVSSDLSVSARLDATQNTQSIKQRIAALPNTLTRLNVNKRDTRTIDEILQDRAKLRERKVLDGDEARHFDDWFSSPKKVNNTLKKATSTQPSVSPSPSPAITPIPSTTPNKKLPPQLEVSQVSARLAKSSAAPSLNAKPSASSSRDASGRTGTMKAPLPDSKGSAISSKLSVRSMPSMSKLPPKGNASSVRTSNSAPAVARKRPRSPSLSPSPPPAKRRSNASNELEGNDIGSAIWKMFGKKRSQYVQRDVFSDDEDMEVGADDLIREEMRRFVRAFLQLLPFYLSSTLDSHNVVCPSVLAWQRRKTSKLWKKKGDTKRRNGEEGRKEKCAKSEVYNFCSVIFLLAGRGKLSWSIPNSCEFHCLILLYKLHSRFIYKHLLDIRYTACFPLLSYMFCKLYLSCYQRSNIIHLCKHMNIRNTFFHYKLRYRSNVLKLVAAVKLKL